MYKPYILKSVNFMLFSMRFALSAFVLAALFAAIPELSFAADPADALRQTTESFLNNEFLTIKKLIVFVGVILSFLMAVKNQSVMVLVVGVAIVLGGSFLLKFVESIM